MKFLALQKGFFTCAGLYVVPLVFGIILIVGVVLQHNSIVRTWILVTIIETVVILATNLGGSIYYSASLDTYYGVIVIAVQVIVACKYSYYLSCISWPKQLFLYWKTIHGVQFLISMYGHFVFYDLQNRLK